MKNSQRISLRDILNAIVRLTDERRKAALCS